MASLGPSGAGSSTVLRCVNHLDTITAGRIYVHGSLTGYSEREDGLYKLSDVEVSRQRRSIGMVCRSFNLFRHLTALLNVMSGPVHVLNMPKDKARQIALNLLEKVGLGQKWSSYLSELSGGQQLRVAIAREVADRAVFMEGRRIVEEDLCETLGVGRTPVREGLLLLYRVSRPYRGDRKQCFPGAVSRADTVLLWMLRVPILFAEQELIQMNIQHRRIVQALIDCDEDTADRAAREHVEATMAIVEPALQF
jgi:hypothetical protein